MNLKRIVPPGQRAYVASHSLGLWVSVGIALSGWVNLLAPSLVTESVVSLLFSPLVLLLFNAAWALAGTLSVFGLLTARRQFEAAGMALLASGMLSYFLAVVSVRPSAALAGLFLPALAIGAAQRAWHLTTHGYVTLDAPSGQRRS